jgi:hypothetical protein
MSIPTTKKEFTEYCLRALGKPVIEINVDEDQVSDRVDQALRFYWDYHFDGTEKVYFKFQVDENFLDTKIIEMPENIIGVVKIFQNSGSAVSTRSMFDIRYQIALNDLYTLTSIGLQNYYMTMEHLSLIQEILVGQVPIRYNRHRNQLHVDSSDGKFRLGEFIIVEAYEVVDPNVYTDVWSDRWLQYYTTQLIKRQWGSNLTKFEGLQLPGGITFNGAKIYDDADAEIKRLEEEMINSYSLPVMDMIG